MTEISSHQKIWRLREGGKHDEEFGLALAILIYLRWADFQEAEQEAIAAFDDLDYDPSIPVSIHWRSWCYLKPAKLHSFLTKELPSLLSNLHNNRQNELATNLYRVGQSLEMLWRFNAEEVAIIVEWLSEQPFETPSDRIALLEVYDDLLSATTHRWSGEYQTPAGIANLIAKLAMPADGERIYDPCFGSARLLTAAYQYVLHNEKDHHNRRGGLNLNIFGVELSSRAYIIGLTRLILAGIDTPQLELGNSLERMHSANPQRDGFDVVLANPPWGMRVPTELMKHYPLPMRDATGMFIQHALAQLRPGGRAVIIVPQGILFRGGPELRLRHMLLKQHTVEAIVSLPETVFLPQTTVRSSIIKIRRGGATERIRMVDAEPFFEKGKGRQPATIRPDLSKKINEYLHTSKPSKHCWDVEAKELTKVDLDFTPRRRDQSELIGILDALRSEIDVLPLKDCCNIQVGKSFRREQLLDTPPNRFKSPKQAKIFPEKEIEQMTLFDTPNVPFVRIKDINRGAANRGSSWLSPDLATSIQSKWKMKAGDVLLSKSGTIGKVGLVRNGAVGGIAANGLFVLKPDQDRLDPHYLIAFINSAECRLWLDDHAHAGTTIKYLSKSVLEKLPVPLPPIQIQHRVATYYKEHNDDALIFLSQLISVGEGDLVSERLNKVVDLLPNDEEIFNDSLDLIKLNSVISKIQSHIGNLTLGQVTEGYLIEWLIKFNLSLSGLSDVQSMPIGSGLLSILQDSRRGMQEAAQVIEGNLPNTTKANRITALLSNWLEKACSVILTDVKLVFITEPETIVAGELIELSLIIKNISPLPLRNLLLSTDPDWGHGKITYLSENTKETIHLSGFAPKSTGKTSIKVSWSGIALDGHHVEGEQEIALSIVDSNSEGSDEQVQLGKSPYFVSQPVGPDRNDVFFGRDEQMAQIRRQVSSGNVILLEGNRRSGKSSILKHLEGPNTVPNWFGIYCSFQGAEGSKKAAGMPTAEVWRVMAISVAEGLLSLKEETPLPDGKWLPANVDLGISPACRRGINEEAPWADFREYLRVVMNILTQKSMGLLLMLDEFDKLQEGIDNKVTSPQIPENIRYLVQNIPRFSAILTGSRRMKRLREEYWSALYGLGHRVGVTALPEEAARSLVIKPVEDRLTYTSEAVNRAIHLTSRQPYLLQCLCNHIFDMSVQLETRSVNLDMVNQAGNVLVNDNEHFASLWDYATTDRRRFLLALCHKEETGPDLLRLGVIQERLFKYGMEIEDEILITDLEFLQELELIELVGAAKGGHYILSIPLMGIWIERQQDFAAVLSKARLESEDNYE